MGVARAKGGGSYKAQERYISACEWKVLKKTYHCERLDASAEALAEQSDPDRFVTGM